MSKFDFMLFTGAIVDEFVVHAGKYTKEQAVAMCSDEYYTAQPYKATENMIEERYAKYYVNTPSWCCYREEGGCYTYCGKNQRGAFPVWVIPLEEGAENDENRMG